MRRHMPPTAWPDVTHYIGLLTKARTRPDRDSIPVCHFHVEEMAQSIHRRELEDTVLVVVGPGIKEPELFSCILCQKDRQQNEQPPPGYRPARPGTIGGEPGVKGKDYDVSRRHSEDQGMPV